ncbi:MAG: DUF21 domain-containing protein [Magnetococcales bacterium]|nr:DUF21 domain-containing protein [Magnetococcales bacterium]
MDTATAAAAADAALTSAQQLEIIIRFCVQAVLLTASAFFSGSETALFSLSKLHLQKLRTSNDPMSDTIHALLDEPRRLIVSILCGNELVNIASSANMAAILIMLVGAEDASWVNILIMVPVLLLVGEVTPKTIAVTFPAKFASQLTGPLLPKWIKLITPLREVVRVVADMVTTFFVGTASESSNILAQDEFQTLIEYGEQDGALSGTERVLINNMLDANAVEVVEIMTPRTRVQYLNADSPLPELVDTFREWRRPRIPIVKGHKDNIIGMMHSEDILRLVEKGADFSKLEIEDIIQPARFVPPTKKVDQMFDYFQAHNTRVALILSEDGGMVGLVTLRDVLMFTFGGISSSEQLDQILEHEGTFNLPGDMRLREFNDMFRTDFNHPRTTTVAGFVFSQFGYLPHEGDSISHQNFVYTVTKMEGLRIKSLQLTIKESFEQRAKTSEHNKAEEGMVPVADDDSDKRSDEAVTDEAEAVTDEAEAVTDEVATDGEASADDTDAGDTKSEAKSA